MVKPLAMGIIGGIIGAIAIIGGLFTFSAYQNAEYQRFYDDYLTASSYQNEIDDFLSETCLWYGGPPSSLSEAEEKLEILKLNLQKRMQNEDRLSSLRQEVKNIQQKYSGTQYYNEFNFQEYECPLG